MSIFEINKKNLIYNANVIKSRLKSNVKFCAMVKGDAYGHNAKVIAKILEQYVDYFGVASIDEGITLRRVGIIKPILCVGKCDLLDVKKASFYGIEFAVESLEQVKLLSNINGIKVKVHIK
ncbi:MAG: alanine racemase, partial [Christensenellales bacterium]